MESIIVSLLEEKLLVKKKKRKKERRDVKASRQLGITSSRKVELEKNETFLFFFPLKIRNNLSSP